MNTLTQSIEAILFATSEPQSFASLAARLSVTKDEIAQSLAELATTLEGHGISVIMHNETATLATTSSQSTLIESIRKEELMKELSKASAETLAIVCYHPGATKAEIEFIRGVNASYSLRALQIRGLIESKQLGRSTSYHPTIESLEHFGAHAVTELPNYAETKQKIDALLARGDDVPTDA